MAFRSPKTLIFDVNETLLDLSPLKASVGAALGGQSDLLPLWFTTMLHYSLVETLNGSYRDFGEVGAGALVMTAQRAGIELDLSTAKDAVIGPIRDLPAYPDVAPGLEKLRASGFELTTLTNSSIAGVNAQLANAGIDSFFSQIMSTESVQAFKPHASTYSHALASTGSEPAETMMVAAHAWDLAGARTAGMQTAFIARPGAALYPNVDPPLVVANDILHLADLITP